jgi:hypothetical protein
MRELCSASCTANMNQRTAGRPNLAELSRFDRREESTKFIRIKVDITSTRTSGTPHNHATFMRRYLDAFTGLAETRLAPNDRRTPNDIARSHTSHPHESAA